MAIAFASAMVDANGGLMPGAHNVESSKLISAGTYMVTYKAGFIAGAGPQVTPLGTQTFAGVNIAAQNTCEVLLQQRSGQPINSAFSFLVMGDA